MRKLLLLAVVAACGDDGITGTSETCGYWPDVPNIQSYQCEPECEMEPPNWTEPFEDAPCQARLHGSGEEIVSCPRTFRYSNGSTVYGGCCIVDSSNVFRFYWCIN